MPSCRTSKSQAGPWLLAKTCRKVTEKLDDLFCIYERAEELRSMKLAAVL